MRIDLLTLLVPGVYKFRQKVIDNMFSVGSRNPKPTCHLDELTKSIGASEADINSVILYLVRNGYAKHVGNEGVPLYALTAKGQSASLDREFHRTGRNERSKNLQVYSVMLGVLATILGIGSLLYTHQSRVDIDSTSQSMELRIERLQIEVSELKAKQHSQVSESAKFTVKDSIPIKP